MSEESVELWAERALDRLDKELMRGAITGAQYSKRSSDLAAISDSMARGKAWRLRLGRGDNDSAT